MVPYQFKLAPFNPIKLKTTIVTNVCGLNRPLVELTDHRSLSLTESKVDTNTSALAMVKLVSTSWQVSPRSRVCKTVHKHCHWLTSW